jgi:hypothetical protein
MHILGSMIRLDNEESRIPIPWWHRASLGFQTDTQVYVSVTDSQAGRPGDLLVSVLNPNHWAQHVSVSCAHDDAPGVIEKAFEVVHEWNIALAETVTVEGGKRHGIDFICEPYHQLLERRTDEEIEQLMRALETQFPGSQVSPFRSLNTSIVWNRLGRIENGWVTFPSNLDRKTWRDVIEGQLSKLADTKSAAIGDFDTQKLVLSVDTTVRLFRGVVPRKGTLTVSIQHADEPGVLKQLAASLRYAGVNVLSCLLKRGGAASKNAILVAVCEPARGVQDDTFAAEIRRALDGLPPSLRPEVVIKKKGVAPEKVIYSQYPGDVVAHVPGHIKARVVERRAKFPTGKFPVFLSRRFLFGEWPGRYAEEIRRALEAEDCVAVEAEVRPGGMRTSFEEVSAAMWAASAGIVLGVDPSCESEVAFSLNLAHEFGFIQGQGKPLLLLVEAGSNVEKELDTWSNLKGVTAPRFTKAHALLTDEPDSIQSRVRSWLADIRREEAE